MANGFVPSLLAHAKQVFSGQTPSVKLTPPGYLQMLLANKPAGIKIISKMDSNGHYTDVKIKYRQRGLVSSVASTDTCTVDVTPSYLESSIPALTYKKIGIKIDDETIRKYEAEASRTIAVGNTASPLMQEIWSAIVEQMNGFVGAINSSLLSSQAAAWGNNAVTGLNTATAISFSNSNQINYNNGIVKLLSDIQNNEIYGKINIVGNGVISAFDIARQFQAQANQHGFDPSAFNTKIYNDVYSRTAWGDNHFGVFAQDAVGFLDIDKNVGSFVGCKGGSYFFNMPIPMAVSGVADEVAMLNVDCQLKYVDCPTTVVDGETTTVTDRGWVLFVSKHFGQFNIPSDAFASGDRLTGFNGTLHYNASIA